MKCLMIDSTGPIITAVEHSVRNLNDTFGFIVSQKHLLCLPSTLNLLAVFPKLNISSSFYT